jgi:probable rRNA maturation factor
MPVEVFVADEQSDRPVDPGRWATLAEAVLRAEGMRGDAELSVLFVDEPAIAALNSRFLGKDGPTDVLSFPIEDEPVGGGRSPDSGGTGPGWMPPDDEPMPTLLGDVVICPEIAWRQAPEHAGTYDDELALLVVHGILHLLGMDHEEEAEAEVMERRENELLDRFHRGAAGTDAIADGAVAVAGNVAGAAAPTPVAGAADRAAGSSADPATPPMKDPPS